MRIGAWDRSTQLQFVTFNIFACKIFEQKQYKKYAHQFRKKKKSKQFNLYGKLTKVKSNFDFN